MRFLWPIFAAMAVMPALLPRCAGGQTPGTGAIAGSVYDSASHVVSRAQVVAINQATHLSRTVTTSDAGFYHVPVLPPGIYAVTVDATGFAQSRSSEVEVTASETTSLNVTLAVASVGQSVQVEATPENINLESSTLGGLVDETAVRSLPLSNRNYTQILGLSPGVVVDLPNATALGNGTENVSSNGGTPLSNNIQFNAGSMRTILLRTRLQMQSPMRVRRFQHRTQSRSFACRQRITMPHTEGARARMSIW